MDYMMELATFALPILTGDPDALHDALNDKARGWAAGQRVRGQIESVLKDAGPDTTDIWRWGPAEARRDLMTDLLYQDPHLAVTLANEVAGVYPSFILELADRLRTSIACQASPLRHPLRWIRSKFGSASKISGGDPYTEAASQGQTPIGEKWTNDPLCDLLLANPEAVFRRAQQLKMAAPFSFVLRAELEEIEASRARRSYAPNYAAMASQWRAEIERLKGVSGCRMKSQEDRIERLRAMVNAIEDAQILQTECWARQDRAARQGTADPAIADLSAKLQTIEECLQREKREVA